MTSDQRKLKAAFKAGVLAGRAEARPIYELLHRIITTPGLLRDVDCRDEIGRTMQRFIEPRSALQGKSR